MALTLDSPEAQALINFDTDPTFTWHLRVLVVKLEAGSQWVGFTTDLEVEVGDIALHVVIVVGRAAPFPARVAGNVYSLVAITDQERERPPCGSAMPSPTCLASRQACASPEDQPRSSDAATPLTKTSASWFTAAPCEARTFVWSWGSCAMVR